MGGGADFQNRLIAYVAVHVLCQRRLGWFRAEVPDVPRKVAAETGGPGDDLGIEFAASTAEVQAKRGLSVGSDFWDAIDHLVQGIDSDSRFHGVLAVESNASATIREQLREDLDRLRQGRSDDLRALTNDVLQHLTDSGVPDPSESLHRLFIVKLDLQDDSSADRKTACAMLTSVLADETQAESAWAALVQEAGSLTRKRGQLDGRAIVNLLASHGIDIRPEVPPAAIEEYLRWVSDTTTNFRVPGLGVALPIRDAWVQLHVLADADHPSPLATVGAAVAHYREWDRLARHDDSTNAKDIAEVGYRVVVVGGPGSGKSTLCRKVTNELASLGERILSVRLPIVLRLTQQGRTIDEAILTAATEGCAALGRPLLQALEPPDCLVADGLDECDPHRQEIASALAAWAAARPRTRVVVTTRPVGHDPALFPRWTHAELLPLDRSSLRDYAKKIIAAADGSADALSHSSQFTAEVDANRVGTLAARNPLLLGLMIQLWRTGSRLGDRRALLYEQIVEQWRKRADRSRAIDLAATVAHRSLNAIGWILMNASTDGEARAYTHLIRHLGKHLADMLGHTQAHGEVLAEECLEFWEQQGLIETLHVGVEDIVVFVHPTLEEFAAARYTVGCDDAGLAAWLNRIRREPRWREVILLAAGCDTGNRVITILLSLDDPGDITATEGLLAASALSELAAPPPPLVREVVTRAATRLASSIPQAAYEAADVTEALAPLVPDVVHGLIAPLVGHSQSWTHESALRLTLAVGGDVADLDAVEQYLDRAPPPRIGVRGSLMFSSDRGNWNRVVVLGARELARRRPGDATVSRLKRIVSEGRVSVKTVTVLLRELSALGATLDRPIIDLAAFEEEGSIFDIKGYRDADRAFLEAAIRIASPTTSSHRAPRKLAAIGALVWGSGLAELNSTDWYILRYRHDTEAFDTVLRGAIRALDISDIELADDATYCLEQMDQDPSVSLISLIPQVVIEPAWERGVELELSVEYLVRALEHPSMIVAGLAAHLLDAGAGGVEAAERVKTTLRRSREEQALQVIALLAESLWGGQANDVLFERLDEELTRGCHWLYRALSTLPGARSDARFIPTILRGLSAADSLVATAASTLMFQLDRTERAPLRGQLQDMLDRWTSVGAWCARCEQYTIGSSCQSCRAVPESPRANLIRALADLGAYRVEDLLALDSDARYDVRDVACELLTLRLSDAAADELIEVVSGLTRGEHSQPVAKAVLATPPEGLRRARRELMGLFESPSASIRYAAVDALPTAGWLEHDDAVEVAQRMLRSDPEPEVRSRALSVLRSLQARSEIAEQGH